MTKKLFRISLSKLKCKRLFTAIFGSGSPYAFCLFQIRYMNSNGLPYYELIFLEESTCMNVSTNNAVSMVRVANEYFDVVLVP